MSPEATWRRGKQSSSCRRIDAGLLRYARNDTVARRLSYLFIVGLLILLPVTASAGEKMPLYSISQKSIEETVARELMEKGAGDLVEARLTGQEKNTIYGSDTPVSVQIKSLDFQANGKRWSANVLFVSEGSILSAIPMSGRYQVMVRLPVLARTASGSQIIGKDDIVYMDFPEHLQRGGIITNAKELIGQAVRRTITAARPIRSNEISAPVLVKNKSIVQMNYQAANMHITTTGQALTDGAKGDIINIRNLNSNHVIRAVVTSENSVSVMPLVQTSALGNDHVFN